MRARPDQGGHPGDLVRAVAPPDVVELGTLTLEAPGPGLAAGTYVALLSHSGSRGTGARIAGHDARLGVGSEAGAECRAAMELMGGCAAADHAVIHRDVIVQRTGATPAGEGVLGAED